MPITVNDDSVTISLADSPETSVNVLNYGATVLSWKIAGEEQLWLSESSKLDGSRAVRGGIPLVFPRFGPVKGNHPETDSLPQHGFARSVTWELLGQVDEQTVQYGLKKENLTEDFVKAWPYDFTLIYTVSLQAKSLELKLEVENAGKEDFDFNVLYHTYFKIPEIEQVSVNNLSKLAFYNKVTDSNQASDDEPSITFNGEVDRVYQNTPNVVEINANSTALFKVESDNLKDVVVWNPWTEKAEGMSDFSPKSGFHQMVCVENGSVSEWQKLQPGELWASSVKLHRL